MKIYRIEFKQSNAIRSTVPGRGQMNLSRMTAEPGKDHTHGWDLEATAEGVFAQKETEQLLIPWHLVTLPAVVRPHESITFNPNPQPVAATPAPNTKPVLK